MLSTDLGACEWFVWDLRRSNLIDRGQLDQIVGEFLTRNPGAEPPSLAEYLVGQGILTEFQAERLLQGKTQGFVLGPFTLMDALGAGSMGTVYKAQSKTDNKWYAVKVLPRRSMWNVRIARRKVRLFESAQHPSVVPFVDVGTSGGMHYLAWPLVEGRTLDKIVEEKGKLPSEQVAQYIIQAVEGLNLCHQQGLFHGLLKPSNLMISPEGQVKILDFGIGCLLAETEGESLVDTMSTANSVNSGLDCASPESIMDPTNLNAVGDQYSLGCVMYYCLTGRYPFPDGTAVEKMMCHQHKQPTAIKEINPQVSDEMVAVIERLMQKNPADRYANCEEMVEALRPLAQPSNTPIRRGSMSMPRLKVPRPAPQEAPEAPEPPPENQGQPPIRKTAAPATRISPRLGQIQPPAQPLPPRAPSAVAQPREAGRNGASENKAPGNIAPKPALRSAARPAPAPVQPQEIEDELPEVEMIPEPQQAPVQAGQRFSLVTVILLATLAGVAAFMLSKFIPM